jgi:uncharacterized membrane protein YukC
MRKLIKKKYLYVALAVFMVLIISLMNYSLAIRSVEDQAVIRTIDWFLIANLNALLFVGGFVIIGVIRTIEDKIRELEKKLEEKEKEEQDS